MTLTFRTADQKAAISNSSFGGRGKQGQIYQIPEFTMMAPLILEKHVLNWGLSQHPIIGWPTWEYHIELIDSHCSAKSLAKAFGVFSRRQVLAWDSSLNFGSNCNTKSLGGGFLLPSL